jgi:hypothetical protein
MKMQVCILYVTYVSIMRSRVNLTSDSAVVVIVRTEPGSVSRYVGFLCIGVLLFTGTALLLTHFIISSMQGQSMNCCFDYDMLLGVISRVSHPVTARGVRARLFLLIRHVFACNSSLQKLEM